MPYTQTTLASATSELSSRLKDPDDIHWSLTEKQDSIRESLRIFQSLTGFYRERAVFNTVASQPYYDLRTLIPSQYSFSITDLQLLSEIQAHLLEPVSNPWTGSLQFSISDIASALNATIDDFLLTSGIYATRSLPLGAPTPVGRIALSNTVIDIRRASWKDSSTNKTYALRRTDEYASQSYRPQWPQTPSLPFSYSVAQTPPVQIQLIPAPSNAGSLDICTVDSTSSPISLNPSSPQILNIPDDFCWGVKWGALTYLLSEDGPARDPERAKYSDQLYQLSRSVAKTLIVALEVRVNDELIPISSLDDIDNFYPDWQNRTGRPSQALFVSPNLMTLCGDKYNTTTGIPDSIYGISIDLARSFPVPINSSSFIQVGRELIDNIIDMAQHICSFKMSGTEFLSTLRLRDDFLKVCSMVNSRILANTTYKTLLDQPSTRQQSQVPRMIQEVRS